MRSRETFRLAHAVLFDDAPGEAGPAPRTAFATAGSGEALHGVEARHVMQVFKHALPTPTGAHKLALLAPDVVEDILEGRQPPELTASRLKRMTDLPLSWAKQRQFLGFS